VADQQDRNLQLLGLGQDVVVGVQPASEDEAGGVRAQGGQQHVRPVAPSDHGFPVQSPHLLHGRLRGHAPDHDLLHAAVEALDACEDLGVHALRDLLDARVIELLQRGDGAQDVDPAVLYQLLHSGVVAFVKDDPLKLLAAGLHEALVDGDHVDGLRGTGRDQDDLSVQLFGDGHAVHVMPGPRAEQLRPLD